MFCRAKGDFWSRAQLRRETVRLVRHGAKLYGRQDMLPYGATRYGWCGTLRNVAGGKVT